MAPPTALASAAFVFIGLALRADPQAPRWNRARVEMPRAVLVYDPEDLDEAEARSFARLLDQGVADVESLVSGGLPPEMAAPPRVRFVVSRRIGISRSFRRTVLLPLDRVRERSAPYLHETTHVLVPVGDDCVWLSEGLASYVESRVSETLGGYDAHVFTRAGNEGIHAAARRFLDRPQGRNVLPFVGADGSPPRLDEDRWGVARPFYVLSQSLVKYIVDQAGLDALVRAAVAADPLEALASGTGRSASQWKDAWLTAIKASPRVGR